MTTNDTNNNNNNVTVTIELKQKDDDFPRRKEHAERIAAHLRDGDYKLKPGIQLEMVIVRASEGRGIRGVTFARRGGWAKLWVKWTLKHSKQGDTTILFERLEKCESHGFLGLKDLVVSNAGEKVLHGRLKEDMIRNIRIKAGHALKSQKTGKRPDVTVM